MRVSGVPYEVDNIKKAPTMKFKFVHEAQIYPGEETVRDVLTKEIEVSDWASWQDVHDMFLDFLGAAYGYNIKEQVKNEQPNTFSNT